MNGKIRAKKRGAGEVMKPFGLIDAQVVFCVTAPEGLPTFLIGK